eukprot:m.50340 g.50340  ORF g.50340 m.50340 type:complete len:315 (-) comp11574_c1_seq1:615-1559(-)
MRGQGEQVGVVDVRLLGIALEGRELAHEAATENRDGGRHNTEIAEQGGIEVIAFTLAHGFNVVVTFRLALNSSLETAGQRRVALGSEAGDECVDTGESLLGASQDIAVLGQVNGGEAHAVVKEHSQGHALRRVLLGHSIRAIVASAQETILQLAARDVAVKVDRHAQDRAWSGRVVIRPAHPGETEGTICGLAVDVLRQVKERIREENDVGIGLDRAIRRATLATHNQEHNDSDQNHRRSPDGNANGRSRAARGGRVGTARGRGRQARANIGRIFKLHGQARRAGTQSSVRKAGILHGDGGNDATRRELNAHTR